MLFINIICPPVIYECKLPFCAKYLEPTVLKDLAFSLLRAPASDFITTELRLAFA